MTPRQQRRLQQKLALKAEKKLARQGHLTNSAVEPTTPADAPEPALPSEANSIASKPEASATAGIVSATEPRTSAMGHLSHRKLEANRANAQLSTGATSLAGKQIVSQNATRHGLTGKFQVLPGESQSDFDQLLAAFLRDEAPADQEETEFVQQMAEAIWLSSRSSRLQNDCFVAIQSGTPADQQQAKKDLALYMRYQTTHERTFVRFSSELRKRRNERRKAERGFVSQKYREAEERRREVRTNQKKELHDLRQTMQILRQERVQIQNRLAAAKAEALELKNLAKKEVQTLAAAA